MRSTCTMSCKFCDKKWEFKSNWLPVEMLELWSTYVIFFHGCFHHTNEMAKGIRFFHYIKLMIIGTLAIIVFTFIVILRIVLYPLYWFLEKLYEY